MGLLNGEETFHLLNAATFHQPLNDQLLTHSFTIDYSPRPRPPPLP